MKTITKPLLFVALSCVLMAASCNKPDFPSPDPFLTLDNQMVCKINGVEWKSTEKGGGFYRQYNGHEYIYLGFGSGWQSINIFINQPYDKPFYIFNTSTHPGNVYPKDYISFRRWYPGLTPGELYVTNETDTGRVDIVLMDRELMRIKGKFFFTGKDMDTGEKIIITEGYFDFHYW